MKTFNSLVRSAYAKYAKHRLNDPKAPKVFTWEIATGELRDIVGARIVCLNLSDVVKVVRRVLSLKNFAWQRGEIGNFYEDAKASHYRTWQVQLEWHRQEKEPPVWVEVQVRTILEDGWAEWEHELFYKHSKAVPISAWNSLTLLHDKDKKQISDSLFEAAKSLDRMREIFDIAARMPPEYINRELEVHKGHPLEQALVDLIAGEPFCIDVKAANLTYGLRPEQVTVDWKSGRFIGLQLLAEGCATEHIKRAQRFAFDEVYGPNAKGTRLHLALDRYDLESKLVDELDRHFSAKAEDLLRACYVEKKATAHRTFFNEYQARLDEFRCADSDRFNTGELLLQISKTNFAFEICTTYVLDEKRTIAPLKDGSEQGKVGKCKKALRPAVEYLEEKLRAALNAPHDRRRYSANPIGVHVNVICCPPPESKESGKKLIIMRRGAEAALHQHEWSTASSGVMVPLKESIEAGGDIPGLVFDPDSPGDERKPSVFRAVQRELEEELALHVPIDHIRVIALLFDQITGQPLIVAEAYTPLNREKIEECRGTAPERWEVNRLVEVPLTENGLDRLFADEKVDGVVIEDAAKEIWRPPLSRTAWNAKKGVEMWGMRYAVAVLLTFWRHVGRQAVEKHMRAPVS